MKKFVRPLLMAAALGLSFSLLPAAARAEAPQVRTQAPGFYRLALGAFEVTALYDGYTDLGAALLLNAKPAQIQDWLAARFLAGETLQTAVNGYLINTGEKLVLVDAGAAHGMGDSLGALIANLEASGYAPEQVDAVLLTHLHGDHANGLLDAKGKAAFPNATVYVNQAEADFWLADNAPERAAQAGLLPPALPAEQAKPLFQGVQANVAPYRAAQRFKTLADGAQVLPGIRLVAAYGHTPGHSAFLVTSGQQQLLIAGDIAHSAAVQFAHPEVAFAFDSNAPQAVAARKAVFARAAREKLLVAGMHLPFPGIGHVRAARQGYEWIPVEYSPIRQHPAGNPASK
ncbi:MAG: MBL fold metallo-hydrolase [Burkholderiaceae bacterium]|jgi:glyoxylase-like metal-dependent hydrolase (beta-lactamase superfamily II)|nr:MBL fold metallo-hydrolase [Burkholderiaceae bacterium]